MAETSFNLGRLVLDAGLIKLTQKLQPGIDVLSNQILGLQKKLSAASADFAKSTGMMDLAGPVYRNLSGQLRGLGMDYGEASRHLSSLIKEIPIFLDLSKEEQKSIAVLSGQFAKLGIDTGTFTRSFMFMSKTLGMPIPDIKKMQLELYGLSRSLKIPPEIIMKDFTDAMPKLAIFGEKAPEVFAKAESYAKKLGISMSTVVGMADKFETFDDAVEKSSNLNVLLRQNLFEAEELSYASPTEKIKIFVNALEKYKDSTGKSFSDMSVFMQKQMAAQSGFTVQELANLSKHTARELESLDDTQLTGMLAGEDLEKKIKKNASATISLEDRMGRMADAITSKFLFLGATLEKSLGKAFKTQLEMADEAAALIKKNPAILDTLQKMVTSTEVKSIMTEHGLMGDRSILGALVKLGSGPIPDKAAKALQGALDKIIATTSVADIELKKIAEKGTPEEKVQAMIKLMTGGVGSEQLESAFGEYLGIVGGGAKKIAEVAGGAVETAASVLDFKPDESQRWGQLTSEAFKIAGDGLQQFGGIATTVLDGFNQKYLETMNTLGNDPNINPMSRFLQSIEAAVSTTMRQIETDIASSGRIMNVFKPIFDGISGAATAAFDFSVVTMKDLFKSVITSPIALIAIDEVKKATIQFRDFVIDSIKQALFDSVPSLPSFPSFSLPKIPTSLMPNSSSTAAPAPNLSPKISITGNIDPKIETSIQNISKAVDGLNNSLLQYDKNKNIFSDSIGKITAPQLQTLDSLTNSMEKYSNALEKINKYSSEQDKIKKTLETLGTTIASAFANIGLDSKEMGKTIGQEVASAVKEAFK